MITGFTIAKRALIAAVAAMAATTIASPALAAPPLPKPPQAPTLTNMTPADAARYQSPASADAGSYFFITSGGIRCSMRPIPGYVKCNIAPATTPAGTKGIAIVGGQAGPYFIGPAAQSQFSPNPRVTPRVLRTGSSLTLPGSRTACGVLAPTTVYCTSGDRAFYASKKLHWFVYPKGDRYHSPNPRIAR